MQSRQRLFYTGPVWFDWSRGPRECVRAAANALIVWFLGRARCRRGSAPPRLRGSKSFSLANSSLAAASFNFCSRCASARAKRCGEFSRLLSPGVFSGAISDRIIFVEAVGASVSLSSFRSHHAWRNRRKRFVLMPRPVHKARCGRRCFRQGIDCRTTSLRAFATVRFGRGNPAEG